jgi:hypothetical protein
VHHKCGGEEGSACVVWCVQYFCAQVDRSVVDMSGFATEWDWGDSMCEDCLRFELPACSVWLSVPAARPAASCIPGCVVCVSFSLKGASC